MKKEAEQCGTLVEQWNKKKIKVFHCSANVPLCEEHSNRLYINRLQTNVPLFHQNHYKK